MDEKFHPITWYYDIQWYYCYYVRMHYPHYGISLYPLCVVLWRWVEAELWLHMVSRVRVCCGASFFILPPWARRWWWVWSGGPPKAGPKNGLAHAKSIPLEITLDFMMTVQKCIIRIWQTFWFVGVVRQTR